MSLSSLSSVEDESRDIYSDDGTRSDYGTIGGSSSPIIEVANGLSASQQRRRISASVEKRQARPSINTGKGVGQCVKSLSLSLSLYIQNYKPHKLC